MKRFEYEHPIIRDSRHGLNFGYAIHIIPSDLVEIANDLQDERDKLRDEQNKLIEWLQFNYECTAEFAEDPDDESLPSSILGEVLKKIKELDKQ